MISNMSRTARVLSVATVLVALAMVAGRSWSADRRSPVVLADAAPSSYLPAILKPQNTPTPAPTATPVPTATVTPGATGTPRPTPNPAGDNLLVNGSFEDGWIDLPPAAGNLTNQQPIGWTLTWLPPGTLLWDSSSDIARGVPECLHKPYWTLPPNEWLGAPDALILDGDITYKMFHHGTSFGSELWQDVGTLQAGKYRLTMPVQLHWQEKLDPNDPTWDTYTAESGAWILVNGQKLGRWTNAREMGDREWTYHIVEFELSAPADVEVLLRFKSKYANKDFFVDAVVLETID